MLWSHAFELLKPLATEDLPGGAWPPIRYHKCQALFKLAQAAPDGAVVELGAGRGLSAIALALGAHGPVHAIDDYRTKHGWAGEVYGFGDLIAFARNVTRVKVDIALHIADASVPPGPALTPIALLVWDLGARDRLLQDFDRWQTHVVPGGLFACKDLEVQPDFGHAALDTQPGWSVYRQAEDGVVYSWRKHATDG